jgi:uncharacterized membrane protein YeiH
MDIFSVLIPELTDTSGGIVPAAIDYLSVIVGVITGATFACDKRLDIVGTVSLGLIAGYGGGILRDVLLQNHGVYFTQHPYLVLACILMCIVVFYFRGVFRNLESAVFLLDALSVGLFAAAGSAKAFDCGTGVVMSILLGTITAVGGGTLRDVFVGQVPSIFQSGTYYAIAGLAGAIVYTAFVACGYAGPWAVVACVAVTVALRYLSVFFDWRTHTDPRDLSPYVTKPLKRAVAFARGLYLHGRLDRVGDKDKDAARERKRAARRRRDGE